MKIHSNIILNNEIKAAKLIKDGVLEEAEIMLIENIGLKSTSHATYDLLLEVYRATNSYRGLIYTLRNAIKRSFQKKEIYRELRKVIILNKMVMDMNL